MIKDTINGFTKRIHLFKFPYEESEPDYFKNQLKDLKCVVRDGKDVDDEVLKEFKEPLTNINYKFACFNLPPLLGLDDKFDIDTDIKSKLTDYNTEFLFNNNVSSIIMNIFIKSVEESITSYIDDFNTIKNGRFTDPTIILEPDDIKILLKGGLSIRALCNQYLIHIQDTIENNINLDSESNTQFKSLLDIFKSTVDSNIKSPFEGIFKKSDIDYLFYLKKDKFNNEGDYNIVTRDLQKITIQILMIIRDAIVTTNFFDRESIFLDNLKNIFNQNVIDPVTDLPLTHIKFDSTTISSPTAIKTKLKDSNKRSTYIEKMGSITNDPLDSKSLYIIPDNMFIFNKVKIPQMKNIESRYFITTNNNIKIIKGMVETFSLVRLKNCFSCGFNNDPDLSRTFSGELIDVAFLSYNKPDHQIISQNHDFLEIIRQTKDLFNFEVTVFSLQFQMHEIEKMLIDTSLYIWENPKYKKRILRYFFIDLLDKFSSINNINDYIPLHNEYHSIFQYLNGIYVSQLDENNNIRFISKDEEFKGTSKNRFLKYLFKIKSDVKNFVEDKVDIAQFTIDVSGNFNIKLNLETPESIEEFKKYLTGNLIKFEKDLKEILSNVVSISESLFKLYSLYPNKLLEFRKLKIQQKNIKQWGGYKKLYKDFKNKYYNLKNKIK